MLASKSKKFFDLFPAPEFLAISRSGIAISDQDIKFAKLESGLFGKGLQLVHLNRFNNQESDPSSTLKRLTSRYDIEFINAILPDEKAYIFTNHIDSTSRGNIYDAVAFIIEENVPITLSESVFHFQIIEEIQDPPVIKLAVTVVPQREIVASISLLKSAGITPISFDLESQAIARAIIKRGDESPQLIVNLSGQKTGFYMVEKEIVQFSTTRGQSIKDQSAFNGLKEELRRIVHFLNERIDKMGNQERKIEKILLCGAEAMDKNLAGNFLDSVGIEYSFADVRTNVPKAEDSVMKMPFDESLDYAAAIGLVLPRHK